MEGWLLLFRREFWRTVAISLRRFPRDPRARRVIWSTCLMLAFVGVEIRIMIWPLVRPSLEQSRQDGIIQLCLVAILLGCALLVLVLHRWLERRDEQPGLQLTTSAPPAASPADDSLARAVWMHACSLASLVMRGASDGFLHVKTLPPGQEPATRAWLRQRLLATGLWDELPLAVRALHLLPEGEWTDVQVRVVAPLREDLLVLRWALGLDRELRPLDRLPAYQASDAVALLEAGCPSHLVLRPSWDLRAERDQAWQALLRFWMEQLARGMIDAPGISEADREELLAERTALHGGSDMLVGAKTVRELDEAELKLCGWAAGRRHGVLRLLTAVATHEASLEELEGFLYGLLTERDEDESAGEGKTAAMAEG